MSTPTADTLHPGDTVECVDSFLSDAFPDDYGKAGVRYEVIVARGASMILKGNGIKETWVKRSRFMKVSSDDR